MSDGRKKKKYINIFGFFTEPFSYSYDFLYMENMNDPVVINPLRASILFKAGYKKLDVKNAIQYSNEKCLISVTRGP